MCATVLCTCVCERVHVLEIVATIFLFEKVRKCHVDRGLWIYTRNTRHEAIRFKKTSKSACRLSGEGQLHKSQARTNHAVLSDPQFSIDAIDADADVFYSVHHKSKRA